MPQQLGRSRWAPFLWHVDSPLLDRGTSLPSALSGISLGKVGEQHWRSPRLRVAFRQVAYTAGRSDLPMNAHTLCAEAMDSLHSSGMDERRAAAEFLRCSRTATSSEVDREESSFVRELNSFFGEWFSIADTACGVPSTTTIFDINAAAAVDRRTSALVTRRARAPK